MGRRRRGHPFTPASWKRRAGRVAPRGPAAGLSADATREFERLLREDEPVVLSCARKHVRRGLQSKLDPEDVVQDTFLAAWVNWERFDHGATAPHWLTVTALNHVRNVANALSAAKRGGKRAIARRTPAEADEEASALALLEASGPTPEQSASRHEAAESVHRAIAGLPPDRQQAFRLHCVEGLPIAAVAEELGRSQGSVLMLCNRAKKDMREQLCPRAVSTGAVVVV
jgi:RNA polymerase sigma-70 factor (ECF subfamily)